MEIIYKANDGRMFNTYDECVKYEIKESEKEEKRKIEELQNSVSFFFYDDYRNEKKNVSGIFWDKLYQEEFDTITKWLIFERKFDFIVFKDKSAFQDFTAIIEERCNIWVADYFDIEDIEITHKENEEIIFYELGLFPEILTKALYFNWDEPPVYTNGKSISFELENMKKNIKDCTEIFSLYKNL